MDTGSGQAPEEQCQIRLGLLQQAEQIANQLFISVRTAETHRAHIMQKLRLSSRAELVRYALAEGLLDSD